MEEIKINTNTDTKTNTQANTLTQTKEFEEMKIWESLTPEEQQQVSEVRDTIDVSSSQAILQYGIQAQSSISSFSDTVLSQIRSKDSGQKN